ncbi:XkdX family protein [Bacillus sp. Bva_UNVM-123]|uniref:XkdX family protein n=1 Tax=Bacillus sp. Bva_UNVM-123 TaxID=2829798 RepID=UPI00391F6BEC
MYWFPIINKYFNLGIYNDVLGDRMFVGNFVKVGWITEEQFEEITGYPYPAEQEV